MSSTAPTTFTDRSLRLRGRRDLITEPIQFRGTRYWSVKDPLALRYYQLCDEERFILEQADGEITVDELRRRFEAQFAPRKLEANELYAFLGTLHREGLLTSQSSGQAEQLLERHEHSRRQQLLQSITNILAIRFRGLDPEPLLRAVYPRVRWMFSRVTVCASFAVVIGALLSLAVYADTFVARLPRLQSFVSVENLLLMAVVLAACKVLHELGHALTCKHFGGQCHELGVMLLVFTPCLYCNVSDAWMLQNKWKRIAISSAGIYVELFLAAICTFLWWFSAPGTFNSICLNVMFVCSVSTVLFNGNPLLRYDGYFILADLIELPNLREQSQTLIRRFVSRCLGAQPRETWTLQRQHRFQLATYAIAALVYRCILVAGILFAVYRAMEPYRLESIAQLLSVFVLGGMFFAPVWKMIKVARDPQTRIGRGSWRMACLIIVIGGGVSLVGMIPVSRHVTSAVVIEPANAARVHVTVAGRLTQFLDIGQQVQANAVVATLQDAKLERELAALRGERDVQALYAQQLQKLQVLEHGAASGGAGSRIITANEALAATERQLAQKLRDHSRLTLTAPRSGTILPARQRNTRKPHDQLPTWEGLPLEERNIGSYLATDTVVCLIGDADSMKGTALVDQTQIERVEIGQSVRILVDELHEQVLTGTVTEIARVESEQAPPELIAKQLLPADASATAKAYYAVSISLHPAQRPPVQWASGKAKIAVQPLAVAEVLYNYLCNTFRIDL